MNLENQKLFLSSEIASVIDSLGNLAKIDPAKTKVAYIQNTAIPYGDSEQNPWIQDDKQAFLNLAYKLKIFDPESFKTPK